MAKPRILVVEDDAPIRRGMVDALGFEGYEVVEAPDGHAGMRSAVQGGYDLLLLDLVLPGPGGLDILAEVKLTRPTMPVIILSAKGEEADRVRGLKLGADDYVVKPFSVRELLARVEAVLRRSPERPREKTTLRLPTGVADLGRAEIRFDDGTRAELPEREYELLRYLAANAGRVVSRDEILARVWRLDPHAVATRAVDMQIARLRERLRDDAADPRILVTVRGRGYVFSPEARKG
ncbi:response regulator transcription factor [Opitutales bacterium ASA1]|uniref:response regulator transcription factor n=1 Tax=Congregicoccus parvus TaxID=3081749 RepID=UPI002B29A3CE|nr:response regulator transcription factor [Opitutales bacterium ASA1]